MFELSAWLVGLSLLSFVAAAALLPVVVVRIPYDYLSAPERTRAPASKRSPVWRLPVLVLKNLVGVALLVAGALMLVTPGQGVLTLLAGLMLVDFPGKHAAQRWVITRPPVFRAINRLRVKRGHPPLQPVPSKPAKDAGR
jgi:hypothetical protein